MVKSLYILCISLFAIMAYFTRIFVDFIAFIPSFQHNVLQFVSCVCNTCFNKPCTRVELSGSHGLLIKPSVTLIFHNFIL